MSELMTDGKDCFEDVPCIECGTLVRVVYPDSVASEKGEWPEVQALCPKCRYNYDHAIPYENLLRHVEDPNDPNKAGWQRYNFKTRQYEPAW